MTEKLDACSAFSLSSATLNGHDLPGVRTLRRIGDGRYIELDVGLLTSADPTDLDGEATFTVPVKDLDGHVGVYTFVIHVSSWKLKFDTGTYRTGTTFTYFGHVDETADNRIEVEYTDNPGTRIKVVDL